MLIVQKYGGTSVRSIERFRNVARRALAAQRQGHQVIVVTSAMAGETNRLIDLAAQISDSPNPEAHDMLVATGEQVAVALLSMAIDAQGGKGAPFLGNQIRILTDDLHGKARILSIDGEPLLDAVKNGAIPVVAGFQGTTADGRITTLGRGGSDTTAVAIAAAVKADVCDIYTDVDGVYTTDPNICSDARKLERISYEEMLELASLGAKVLQIRSVEFGMKYNVNLRVRSSFSDDEGTLCLNESAGMEHVVVTGIAYSRSEAKITLRGVPDRPGMSAALFTPLSAEGISVDVIIQTDSEMRNGALRTDMSFTVAKGDFKRARQMSEEIAAKIGAEGVTSTEDIAKVSIVGLGMRSHAGVAAKMFRTLAAAGINILMISTSEIKVSAVIESKFVELAVRELHKAFELEKAPEERSMDEYTKIEDDASGQFLASGTPTPKA